MYVIQTIAGFLDVAILIKMSKALMQVWNMMNFIPLIVKQIPIFLSLILCD
jgi:hypothetical protein